MGWQKRQCRSPSPVTPFEPQLQPVKPCSCHLGAKSPFPGQSGVRAGYGIIHCTASGTCLPRLQKHSPHESQPGSHHHTAEATYHAPFAAFSSLLRLPDVPLQQNLRPFALLVSQGFVILPQAVAESKVIVNLLRAGLEVSTQERSQPTYHAVRNS